MNWKRVFASVMDSILDGQYFKRPERDTQQPYVDAIAMLVTTGD